MKPTKRSFGGFPTRTVLGAALCAAFANAQATDYPGLNLTTGTTTLDGGDNVIVGSGTAIRIGDAALNFGPGAINVDSAATAIFSTNGAAANLVFQPGNTTTISTTATTSTTYGIQGGNNSNTTVDLQQNSNVTIRSVNGIMLGPTISGTANRLQVGDGATLKIEASGGTSPKGLMINTNNSASIASGGTLDIDVDAGNWARALELSLHMTYVSDSPDKFTAAAGSTVRLHTVGTNAQGLYMLGEGNAVFNGTTRIHTEGADSAGLYVYRYLSPVSVLTVNPLGADNATITTEGDRSYGLLAINGSQVTLGNAVFTTSGQAAMGLFGTTDNGAVATRIIANRVGTTTTGAGSFGILADGDGTHISYDNGTVSTSGQGAHGVVLTENSVFDAQNSTIAASGAAASGLLLLGATAGSQRADIVGGSITSSQASAIGVDGGSATINLTGAQVSGATNWLYVTPGGVQSTWGGLPVAAPDPTLDPDIPPPTLTRPARSTFGPANLTLTATNSTLTGAAVTQAGSTSTVNLVNSVWNMTGSSNVTNLLNDPSLIDFAAPAGGVYKTLTVANYSGDGTIALNTYLGTDGSPSDKLVVDGGTATGTSKLRIKNTGGPGALTHANGIQVVDAINGGSTDSGAFSLESPVTAGAHEYKLYRGGLGPADASNWYLRSAELVIDPDTGEVEEVPLYRPETAPAVIAPEVARQIAGRMLDTFHDRMGDQYALLSSAERKAGWARVIGQRMKQEWAGSVEPKFSGNIWIGQAGADLLERQRDDGLSDRLGFFGSYGQASGNVSGFVEGRHGNSAGSLRLNAYGLGLYWTRLKRTDWYWDNVLMANYYDGRSRSDRGVGADMDGWGLTASTEFGYSFHPSPDIMIQPQAQLFYQYTDIGNTKDQYSSIRFSGSGAVTGRLGILVQGNADNPDKIRPYARFNLWRRMGHGETVVFGDSDTLRTEYGSTSADVRVGLVAPVSKQTQLYASAGYGFDLDGNQRQAYYGNIGVRYKW